VRAPIRLGLQIPSFNFPDTKPEQLLQRLTDIASTAEAAGFDSLFVMDHLHQIPGVGPQTGWMLEGNTALAALAARTSTLNLGLLVGGVTYRNPALMAKIATTLDVLSGGRAILGIGIGWMKDEFDALGIPFEDRVARTEEACAALRTLWKPGANAFKGEHFRWNALESNPKPVQPGGVPIVVGGHVKGAARRAARVGDGFFPMKTGGDRLQELLDAMGEECARIGRDPKQIEITTALPGPDLDAIRRLEDQGVSRLVMGPPAFDPEGLRKGLDSFANGVMAKL
jgi:probable F420-dependent oxidoreductase